MQEKNIKRLVIKQLKSKFPHWRGLTQKPKKALAEEALGEVMASYQQDPAVNLPLHELTNPAAVPPGIIPWLE